MFVYRVLFGKKLRSSGEEKRGSWNETDRIIMGGRIIGVLEGKKSGAN